MGAVFVTGASGFIGQHLVSHLRQAGAEVVVGLPWQTADIGPLLSQHKVAQVVHLAGMAHGQVAASAQAQLHQVNAVATAEFYRQCQTAGVEAFVWLSSIKVLAETSAQPLAVGAPVAPTGVYAQSKAAGEAMLWQAHAAEGAARDTEPNPSPGTKLVIVRPPLVYGPGVGANFYQLLVWAKRGWPLPLGGATAPRSMVGVGNLVHLIHRGLGASTGTYHVSDGDDWSVAKLLRFCAEQMATPSRLVSLPNPLLIAATRLLGRADVAARLLQPLRVDIAATQSSLGWQPPYSVAQQVEETVQWFLKQA